MSSAAAEDDSEQSDDILRGTGNEDTPPLKKRKRSRDKIGPEEVHEHGPSTTRDPYEQLHRQMLTEAKQLKKLREQCEQLLLLYVTMDITICYHGYYYMLLSMV